MNDIIDFLQKGGIFMYPMVILGFGAFFLIIERWIFITRNTSSNKKLTEEILHILENKGVSDAREKCKNSDGVVSKILDSGLTHYHRSDEVIEKVMDEAILTVIPHAERFLSVIAVIASMMPMLGLLGTVSGMVSLFHTMGGGSDNPAKFAAGISEALIATETGLAFGLPIVFFHSILSYKVEKLIGEMEVEAKRLLNFKIIRAEDKKNG